MVKVKELQQYAVELLVECFATCVLILIGEATIANYKFAKQPSQSTLPVAIAFGVATYSGNTDRNENKSYGNPVCGITNRSDGRILFY
jgi:glycerol uptake facilitator-like aquaporin